MVLNPSSQSGQGQAGNHPAQAMSAHFTLAELTHTDTGLVNEPDRIALPSLVRLVSDALEPMRALVGPLRVNSGFRSPEVNKAIGGVRTSQHMKGQAADVVPMDMDLDDAFAIVKASKIPFDQLILEPTWIHISVPTYGVKPRRQCLKAHMEGKRMVYEST